MSARMGWNPEAPTNPLRVALVAYLRNQLRSANSSMAGPLLAWIAWLEGTEVSDEDLARVVRSGSYATEV